MGPIAIGTIYDMYGIITSGFISAEDALKILSIGPVYTQVTLKTEQAVKALKFLSSEGVMSSFFDILMILKTPHDFFTAFFYIHGKYTIFGPYEGKIMFDIKVF